MRPSKEVYFLEELSSKFKSILCRSSLCKFNSRGGKLRVTSFMTMPKFMLETLGNSSWNSTSLLVFLCPPVLLNLIAQRLFGMYSSRDSDLAIFSMLTRLMQIRAAYRRKQRPSLMRLPVTLACSKISPKDLTN